MSRSAGRAPMRVVASLAVALTPFGSVVRERPQFFLTIGSVQPQGPAVSIGQERPDGFLPTLRATGRRRERAPVAELIRVAKSRLGTPYSWGGTTPAGFDCSGFTAWVFSHFGIELPHSSAAQHALGDLPGYERISDRNDLRPGDLVFHATGGDSVGHVAIYIGDDLFIGATRVDGIRIDNVYDASYWGPLWVGAVRVPFSASGL